jgi:hypothetical protein
VVKPSISLRFFELEKESREKIDQEHCGEVVCLSSFVWASQETEKKKT